MVYLLSSHLVYGYITTMCSCLLYTSPEEAKGVDLLVVSLKYGALAGALDDIREAVGENTIVMSLMNGVDSEEIISTKIDKSHIIYSLIKVASHREGKELSLIHILPQSGSKSQRT